MCHYSVERVLYFIVIADLSYLHLRWKLRCLLVEDLTVLSPHGELTDSSWISWLPTNGYLGSLLVDIMVASSLPSCVELLSTCGELHFLTFFWCYDGAFCFFLLWGTCYNFHRLYSWIVIRFPCLMDCATFSAFSGLCCRHYVRNYILSYFIITFGFRHYNWTLSEMLTLWSNLLVDSDIMIGLCGDNDFFAIDTLLPCHGELVRSISSADLHSVVRWRQGSYSIMLGVHYKRRIV